MACASPDVDFLRTGLSISAPAMESDVAYLAQVTVDEPIHHAWLSQHRGIVRGRDNTSRKG